MLIAIEWVSDVFGVHGAIKIMAKLTNLMPYLIAGRIKFHEYVAGGWSFVMSITRMFDAVSLTVRRVHIYISQRVHAENKST